MTTISSREFNQDAGGAKRAALNGPVFITDRERLAHVLIDIKTYRQLTGQSENILDLLASSAANDVNFEPGRVDTLTRSVDLT